jgi:hypothetical protein
VGNGFIFAVDSSRFISARWVMGGNVALVVFLCGINLAGTGPSTMIMRVLKEGDTLIAD